MRVEQAQLRSVARILQSVKHTRPRPRGRLARALSPVNAADRAPCHSQERLADQPYVDEHPKSRLGEGPRTLIAIALLTVARCDQLSSNVYRVISVGNVVHAKALIGRSSHSPPCAQFAGSAS